MIYAGSPSVFGLGLEGGASSNLLAVTVVLRTLQRDVQLLPEPIRLYPCGAPSRDLECKTLEQKLWFVAVCSRHQTCRQPGIRKKKVARRSLQLHHGSCHPGVMLRFQLTSRRPLDASAELWSKTVQKTKSINLRKVQIHVPVAMTARSYYLPRTFLYGYICLHM